MQSFLDDDCCRDDFAMNLDLNLCGVDDDPNHSRLEGDKQQPNPTETNDDGTVQTEPMTPSPPTSPDSKFPTNREEEEKKQDEDDRLPTTPPPSSPSSSSFSPKPSPIRLEDAFHALAEFANSNSPKLETPLIDILEEEEEANDDDDEEDDDDDRLVRAGVGGDDTSSNKSESTGSWIVRRHPTQPPPNLCSKDGLLQVVQFAQESCSCHCDYPSGIPKVHQTSCSNSNKSNNKNGGGSRSNLPNDASRSNTEQHPIGSNSFSCNPEESTLCFSNQEPSIMTEKEQVEVQDKDGNLHIESKVETMAIAKDEEHAGRTESADVPPIQSTEPHDDTKVGEDVQLAAVTDKDTSIEEQQVASKDASKVADEALEVANQELLACSASSDSHWSTDSDTTCKVYIRDEEYGWLPAKLLECHEQYGIVAQYLPKDWEDATIQSDALSATMASSSATLHKSMTTIQHSALDIANTHGQAVADLRMALWKDYPNGSLPLQNSAMTKRDMVDLLELHEPAILYNLKERHAQGLPYTRVGDILVAMNPFEWRPTFYSRQTQNDYSLRLIWEGMNDDAHPCKKECCFKSEFSHENRLLVA